MGNAATFLKRQSLEFFKVAGSIWLVFFIQDFSSKCLHKYDLKFGVTIGSQGGQ